MDRRAFLRRSATVPVGIAVAGCSGGDGGSDGGNGGDGTDGGTPTDLLASGVAEVAGISTENPADEQGNVEYYRAVAGIANRSGDAIVYLAGTMEFLDAGGEVLETASGAVVGVPPETNWAFVAEYGGDEPAAVASVAVPTVRGFVGSEPEDYRESGRVEVGPVEPSSVPETNRVAVEGEVTNVDGAPLDEVRVFANLWVAEDRVVATATDGTEGLDDGETWAFEATHRFTPHSSHLLPIVTEENEVTIPYVTGATRFDL